MHLENEKKGKKKAVGFAKVKTTKKQWEEWGGDPGCLS